MEAISAHNSGLLDKRVRRDLVLPLSRCLMFRCSVQKGTLFTSTE